MAVTADHLPLAGLPDGVTALRVRKMRTTADGELVEILVGGRHRRTDEVELVGVMPSASNPDIDSAEERWLLATSRRQWRTIEARYGETAWPRAVELVRAGVVRVRCRVDDSMQLAEPRSWSLTDSWERRRRERSEQRTDERMYWNQRALAAADGVAGRCPELAAALRRTSSGSRTTPVLVFAAEDLCAGIIHAGPRAFSQAHFGETKTRDDVAELLTRAGVPEDVLIELGVRRSAFIGVAGPVRVFVGHEDVRLDLLRGPVLVRAKQRNIKFALIGATGALVIVENLQAAETLADQLPGVAVVYSAGFPSDPSLAVISSLASQASRVLLVPDADLGGVRIAERILERAPDAELVDIGLSPHPQREPWPLGGVTEHGLRAALGGPAGALARSCLERGYPVEQELATFEAVRHALR